MPSNLKFWGILILGISASVRQKVRLQCEQWKCVCCSEGLQLHPDWQSAYFTTPVPSSMVWISLCSKKVFKVLNKVTLSAFSNWSANSLWLIAYCCFSNFSTTNKRIAVGLIFLCCKIVSSFFIKANLCIYLLHYLIPHLQFWHTLVFVGWKNGRVICSHIQSAFHCSKHW